MASTGPDEPQGVRTGADELAAPEAALPVLAIAGLKAKDIMGYCLIQLVVMGVVISLGLSFV